MHCSQVLNLLGLSSSERVQDKAGSGWVSSPVGPPPAPVALPDLLDDWDASGEFDKAQVLREAFCTVMILLDDCLLFVFQLGCTQ